MLELDADRTGVAVRAEVRRERWTSSTLILRSRASGVSKDEADIEASWFETAHSRLLTMRDGTDHRITNGLAGTSVAVEIQTLLVSRYSRTASMPLSRPTPENFMPPNGIM